MDADAQKNYGIMKPADYLAAVKKAVEFRQSLETENRTLREDFELGVDEDGRFKVIFSAGCDCGFLFQFKHEENVARFYEFTGL